MRRNVGAVPIKLVQWEAAEHFLKKASPNFAELLKFDATSKDRRRAPRPGELFKSPTLANTFRLLAEHGAKGFYQGSVAKAIIEVVQAAGSKLDYEDLEAHLEKGSEEVEPISIKFNGQDVARTQEAMLSHHEDQDILEKGVEIWECPPNGQGIVALMALGILEQLEKQGVIRQFGESDHNSAEYVPILGRRGTSRVF